MNFERTNKKLSLLEDFYTHFDEDGRLKTRHGYVEFYTNMSYIHKYLNKYDHPTILDLGAGTGAYSVPLSEEGYEVTSVELVKEHCECIISKSDHIKVYQHDARDLAFLKDKYDLILIFGPIYHVHTFNDKIKIIEEAKKHLNANGIMFISYYMMDYGVIEYGTLKGHLKESRVNGALDKNYNIITKENDLFSFDNLKLINQYNRECHLKREKIFASDGLTDYFRTPINKLSVLDYQMYLDYHVKSAERKDLLGYSSHVCDVVKIK